MAQEVTSRDFKLFIEEQRRTNEQLLLLKEKSSEETKNTLLVGELLKQIKQGDEESSTPAEYFKSALPEILNERQLFNQQEIEGAFDVDDILKEHTDYFKDILKSLNSMNDVLRGINETAVDDLDFQKQLEFRTEREEARGGDKPSEPSKDKEDKDKEKKGGIFAAFGSLKTLIKGAGLTIAGLYAFALALKNEEFNAQAKKTFGAIADSFDALKGLFTTISPAVAYIGNFAFKGIEAGFKGIETALKNLDDFVKNGPEPETYAGLPSIASGLKLSIAGLKGLAITKTISKSITAFKTSFKDFNTKVTKFFKPVTDTLTKTINFITKLPILKQIVSLFGSGGKLVSLFSKLAYPITLIQGVFSFATGFIEGFNEGEGKSFLERLQTALNTAVTNLVDTLVLIPLDFIIDAVGWVAGKLGFKSVEENLKDFSLVDFIADLNTSIKQFFTDAMNWVGTKFSGLWQDVKDLMPDISLPKFELPGIDDIINFDLFGIIADKFRGTMKFLGINFGDKIASIFDGLSSDTETPNISTNGVGQQQSNQTLEEIALNSSNLTKQQLDSIKSLMNNNELLLDEMKKNQGNVNVVSGGNNVTSYAKSDLTLSKSAKSDELTYLYLTASA